MCGYCLRWCRNIFGFMDLNPKLFENKRFKVKWLLITLVYDYYNVRLLSRFVIR